jgi:hypothetical protein
MAPSGEYAVRSLGSWVRETTPPTPEESARGRDESRSTPSSSSSRCPMTTPSAICSPASTGSLVRRTVLYAQRRLPLHLGHGVRRLPWPQSPKPAQAKAYSRGGCIAAYPPPTGQQVNGWNFRELYRTLELPGANLLKAAHDALDGAVRAAYGMWTKEDPLTFLLSLNREADGSLIVGPGLPPSVEDARHSLRPHQHRRLVGK